MSMRKEFSWRDTCESASHNYLIPVVVDELQRSRVKKLLDVGSGNGYVANFLSSNLNIEVTGCDSSESGLTLSKSNYPAVDFYYCNLSEKQKGEPEHRIYDASISLEVIEHLFQPRNLIEYMISVTRQGGLIIISTPYHSYLKNIAIALLNGFDRHWHPENDYGHIKFFSIKTLTKILNEYNDIEIQTIHKVGRFRFFEKSMVFVIKKNEK